MQFTTLSVLFFSLLTVGALATPVAVDTSAPVEKTLFKRQDCAPGSPCLGHGLFGANHNSKCNSICRSSSCRKQSGRCAGTGNQFCYCSAK
ncbi:hypothetical protein BJ508DRAFT_420057 [Ascobolus immersus RN42]|uniref:Invertebrate defensins family profile domain-containing protein n=1 Tax=Ascobolus immersus RN42 TaxID=1160509 RepID=A0A3N4H8A8_ASCIM|nr:hypothetical protein BJ508DRAFT_420057 [Ascobolus immersus RN42]